MILFLNKCDLLKKKLKAGANVSAACSVCHWSYDLKAGY